MHVRATANVGLLACQDNRLNYAGRLSILQKGPSNPLTRPRSSIFTYLFRTFRVQFRMEMDK